MQDQVERTGRMDLLAVMLWIGPVALKVAVVVIIGPYVAAIAGIAFAVALLVIAAVIVFAFSQFGRRTEYVTRPK